MAEETIEQQRRRVKLKARLAIEQAGPVFRTDPAAEAVVEAFPTNIVPAFERPGAVGAFLGEAIGGAVSAAIPGAGLVRNLLRPALAGIGAGLGQETEMVVRGEELKLQRGAVEALLAAVPESGEELIRATARGLLRATRGGREVRLDEAAQIASGFSQQTFRPPDRAATQQLFELMRNQNVLGTLTEGAQFLTELEEGPIKRRLMRELRGLDPEVTEALITGTGINLGRLQEFRSLLGQQADAVVNRTGGARLSQLMRQIQGTVDDAIDRQLDTLNLPGVAGTARQAWHRLKAAERMQQLVTTRPVTKIIDGGKAREFNLEALLNILNDNRSQLTRRVNRDLDRIPGSRQAFADYLADIRDLLPAGKLAMTDVQGLRRFGLIGSLDRVVSHVITHTIGQSLFRQAIIEGRGRVSFNTVATIFNILRRREEGRGTVQQGLAQILGQPVPSAGEPANAQDQAAP